MKEITTSAESSPPSRLSEERRVDARVGLGLVTTYGDVRGREQEHLARHALDLAVEPLREATREVNEATRLALAHLRQVDDHGDALAEALSDRLGVLVLARVHREDLVEVGC